VLIALTLYMAFIGPRALNDYQRGWKNSWINPNNWGSGNFPYYRAPTDSEIRRYSLTPQQRSCFNAYQKYNDTKASSLTVGQLELIEGCRSLGMFHNW
jgi:hypothetical protein